MGILDGITSLFRMKKQSAEEKAAAMRWMEGYRSFEQGRELLKVAKCQGNWAQALECFDEAIAGGLKDSDVYGDRGICLQSLNWDLEAIDDFSKAISMLTEGDENANLFFMRSVSREGIRDYEGACDDLNEAIRVSLGRSRLNKLYDEQALEWGYPKATAFYQARLKLVQTAASGYGTMKKLDSLLSQSSPKMEPNLKRRPGR